MLTLGKKSNGAPFELSDNAQVQTFAVLAIRGAGKTCAATVMAEEMFKQNLPWIALDPVGVWWGLRTSPNGKGDGIPVVIFGGEHGDLPLSGGGKKIADALLSEPICAVLDVSRESKRFWHTFLTDFCLRLMELNPDTPRHLFIEEAPEFCLTPDTQILTRAGWKDYGLLKEGEDAIGFDLNDEPFTYQPIERVIVKHYEGELVHFQSRALDCLITPEHRAVIRRFQHDPFRCKLYPWTFCEADKVPHMFMVPSGGAPSGPGLNISDDLLRIIGWVVTDGYFHDRKKSMTIGLQQAYSTIKQGKVVADEMWTVLNQFGASRCERPSRPTVGPSGQAIIGSPSVQFYFAENLSTQVHKWLNGDIHRISRMLIEQCSIWQLKILYQSLMEGDGTANRQQWRFFYAGLNESLADDFQELATRLGIRTVKTLVPQNGQWRVSIAPKKDHWVRRSKETVPYSGIVWCVTLKSGAFVTRRNGRIFVTGNCPQRTKVDLTQRCKEAVERLIRLGRNRGYGCTLISQRPATIDKDVLSQCENLFVMRTVGSHDRKALEAWIEDKQVKEETVDDFLKSLPGLPNGAAYFWSPHWTREFTRLMFRLRETYHPGETREIGKASVAVRLSDVGRFVERLRPALTAKEMPVKSSTRAYSPKRESAYMAPDPHLVERVAELESQLAEERRSRRAVEAKLNRARDFLRPQFETLSTLFSELGQNGGSPGAADRSIYEPWLQKAGQKGCRRLLETVIERGELTKNQLGTLAGVASTKSTFRAYMSWLKKNGLIEVEGETVRLRTV